MSDVYLNHYGEAVAGAFYANAVVTSIALGAFMINIQRASSHLLQIGAQLVMSVYSVASIVESPPATRKTRIPYIVASVVILCLFSLSVALDSYCFFIDIFGAESGRHFLTKWAKPERKWYRVVSVFSWVFAMLTGDGLLVRSSYQFPCPSSLYLTRGHVSQSSIGVIFSGGKDGGF